MTAENRVLALKLAISVVVGPAGGFPAERAGDITAAATVFYRWLEGPAVLILTADSMTFDQAAPEGPGVPTVMKGPNMAEITDRKQYTVTVGEVDSKNQPVTGDNLTWTIDDPSIATITPSADGYSALIAGQAIGATGYSVTDSTVDPPLTGNGSVTVTSSQPTSLTVSEGPVEDQPPAPPAA